MGRYAQWKSTKGTRYTLFSVSGLPISAYLGICGPVECTESDYSTTRSYLANFANEMIGKIRNFLPLICEIYAS